MAIKKNHGSLILLLLLTTVSAHAIQAQSLVARELTPARGHYKSLAALPKTPGSINAEWDNQKFPFDKEAAEKRLSLKPYFLTDVSISEFKIPDPPANSSAQTVGELSYLLQLQSQRAKLDVDASLQMAGVYYKPGIESSHANYTALRMNLFFIGRSMGTWFQPDSLPHTANLMAHVWQDASYYIWSMKYKYLRVRPNKLDNRIQNLEDTDWAAYPSGHATNSYINAYIYQELAPEFADVFIKDAYDMAHSREIIGVHFPSDSEAGRIFARQFVNRLFNNEKFRQEFNLAKQEWHLKSAGYFGSVNVQKTEGHQATKSCGSTSTSATKICDTN
jgi:acid phosphatase (class A)